MTEEEAKTKWCCNEGPDGSIKCCVSQCMAWRWVQLGQRGYCGLAGKP